MTLALIFAVCLILVSPPGAPAVVPLPVIFQAARSEQDSPPTDSPRSLAAVEPTEQTTEPAAAPTQPQDSPLPAEAKPPAPSAQHPKQKTSTPSKPAPKKHRRRKKPEAPPADGPKKVIVNNGGAADPTVQLSPGVSPENASRQRQSTNLLLATAESNLKALAGRQLNASQQDMVTQVREYMKQAKTGADAGDLQRAHNLAFKAKLLSDELTKP